jgi:hypothetical protein
MPAHTSLSPTDARNKTSRVIDILARAWYRNARMVRRIAISICLCLFVLSSSFVAAEPSPNWEQDSQTSFRMDNEDSSSDANRTRRIFKKSPRGKSSLKSLPSLNRPPQAIFLTGYLGERCFIPGLSKASVYQQINVYRI